MYSLRTALKRGAELRLLLVCKVVAAAPDYSLCDMKQTFQTTALNAQCMYHYCVHTIYQLTMRTNLLNLCHLVSTSKNVVFYASMVVIIY